MIIIFVLGPRRLQYREVYHATCGHQDRLTWGLGCTVFGVWSLGFDAAFSAEAEQFLFGQGTCQDKRTAGVNKLHLKRPPS